MRPWIIQGKGEFAWLRCYSHVVWDGGRQWPRQSVGEQGRVDYAMDVNTTERRQVRNI